MARLHPTLPSGHGELTLSPEFGSWSSIALSNRANADAWTFDIAGVPVSEIRLLARSDALAAGEGFSARLGVRLRQVADSAAPLVATGHQPLLYHSGVWVKDFALDRLAEEMGANSIDIVVDTDGFDSVSLTAPCLQPGMGRCKQYLAVGAADSCFALTPVPSRGDVADFCAGASKSLSALPAPAIGRHFSAFCEGLNEARDSARSLAEFVTIARRRYEATANTGYLEVLMTDLATTESFHRFVVHLVLDSAAFATVYNAELQAYRAMTKTRSVAQPFPDLKTTDDEVELPFWVIDEGRRQTLWVGDSGEGGLRLRTGSRTLAVLPRSPEAAVAVLADCGLLLAPKALALTLFMRMFVCDLFIHGIGGGKYDRVTDGVIRRYFGVEPPAFVVASLTMYLPLGAQVVTENDVSVAKERLHRLDHNPDTLIGEVDFDSADERSGALALVQEKIELVASIQNADADKKRIGLRIREVNQALGIILEPVRAQYVADLERTEAQLTASEILTDRTYPFCFWDPAEVADKIR